MRKINLILMLLPSILFFSCNKNDDGENSKYVKVIIQQENLDSRLSQENSGVIPFKGTLGEASSKIEKSAKLIASSVVSDMPLAMVAEVAAPQYEGATLRATHVCINRNFAYVSYNYEGDKYLGAVDLIDITNPNTPKLIESAIFPGTDISSVAYKDNILYLAGAKELLHEDGSNPAVLLKMKLNGGHLSEEIGIIELTGYVGTDVAVGDSYVYGVSGDNGILGAYKLNDNSQQASVKLNDLRSVGVAGGQVVVLRNGGINVFNPTTLAETINFPTSNDVLESKRTIDFYNGAVLAAEGAKGVGVYNLSTGSKLVNIPVGDATGLDVDPSEVVSNAVSVNNEHVFVANGAAGISVLKIVSNKISDLVNFGSLDLSGSANYVKCEDGYVFVADGFGGLKILKMLSSGSGSTAGDCTSYPSYTGGSWLNVNSNETQAYNGAASLAGVNVNASLTWCGSLAISDQLNVNSGGEFYMKGSLSFGSTGKSLIVNSNSKLKVEGSLTVFGNLILNSGATLEFAGSGSTITVFGSVTKGNNVTITGTYTDSFNSLK